MMDICNGIYLSKLPSINNCKAEDNSQDKKEKEKSKYIELIYLFNPVSIVNCANIRLDVLYLFLNLSFIHSNKFVTSGLYFWLNIVINPGNIFLNIFYISFFYIEKIQRYPNFIFPETLPLILFKFVLPDFFHGIQLQYSNYYKIKDTLPNIGIFWSLMPETFLKFQDFSLNMALFYQVLLNVCIICMLMGLNYKNKTSLCFTLLFIVF
jgi:hypothetical protein